MHMSNKKLVLVASVIVALMGAVIALTTSLLTLLLFALVIALFTLVCWVIYTRLHREHPAIAPVPEQPVEHSAKQEQEAIRKATHKAESSSF